MLKAFVYSDDDIRAATGFKTSEIERARVVCPFDWCDNARDADVFWIPIDLGHVEAYHGGAQAVAQALPRLRHWAGNETRHVGYFCSDGAEPTGLPCIMFRQSFYKNRRDPNVVAWPYAVEDFGDLYCDDFGTLELDVSFVGSVAGHVCRKESCDSVANTPGLVSWIDDSRAHWGSIEHTPLGKKRKEIFRQSMQKSVMVLAGRGGGLSSYRFFEAMSAGRIPVLIADDVALPHPNLIEWENCMLQIPERLANATGQIILEFMQGMTDDQLADMGRDARLAWYQYLAPAVWPRMMERCVRERLANGA